MTDIDRRMRYLERCLEGGEPPARALELAEQMERFVVSGSSVAQLPAPAFVDPRRDPDTDSLVERILRPMSEAVGLSYEELTEKVQSAEASAAAARALEPAPEPDPEPEPEPEPEPTPPPAAKSRRGWSDEQKAAFTKDWTAGVATDVVMERHDIPTPGAAYQRAQSLGIKRPKKGAATPPPTTKVRAEDPPTPEVKDVRVGATPHPDGVLAEAIDLLNQSGKMVGVGTKSGTYSIRGQGRDLTPKMVIQEANTILVKAGEAPLPLPGEDTSAAKSSTGCCTESLGL